MVVLRSFMFKRSKTVTHGHDIWMLGIWSLAEDSIHMEYQVLRNKLMYL